MKCAQCHESILTDSKFLKCGDCSKYFHLLCLEVISEEDWNCFEDSASDWKCTVCCKYNNFKGQSVSEQSNSFNSSNMFPVTSVSDKSGVRPKTLCVVCKKGFSHNSVRAVCISCNGNSHFKCEGITKDDYTKVKMTWNCFVCQKDTGITDVETSMKYISEENISLMDILKEMKGFRKVVEEQNKEFVNSLNKYSSWIEENGNKIENVDSKISLVLKEMEVLKQENCDLKKANQVLTKRVNNLEQSIRDNVIEISGVPYKKEENVLEIVGKVSAAIGFDFQERVVDSCYRYKQSAGGRASSGPPAPSGIVVRFVRKIDKEQFVYLRRKKRNLNSRDIGFMEGNASVVYVNDSLTPEKRKLLNAARAVKQEKDVTFLWVRNGRIFMRKNQGDRYTIIDSLEDLSKIK